MSDNGHHDDDEYDPNADIDMQPVRKHSPASHRGVVGQPAALFVRLRNHAHVCCLLDAAAVCTDMCVPPRCVVVAAVFDRCWRCVGVAAAASARFDSIRFV
jgi:hypothetical protein